MAGKSKGHIHCPVNGWDCPYYGKYGTCKMWPESDPVEECDDFYYFWGDEEGKDYVCYEDHEDE